MVKKSKARTPVEGKTKDKLSHAQLLSQPEEVIFILYKQSIQSLLFFF
jgi:hypothetical protein